MKVLKDVENNVINFLWGPMCTFGHNMALVEEITYGYDTDVYGTGDKIQDKMLDNVPRYWVDAGVVKRRSDAEMLVFPAYVLVKLKEKINDWSGKKAEKLALKEIKKEEVLTAEEEAYIDGRIAEL